MSEKPSFFTGWVEPESAANTAYPPQAPYNNVTSTPSGHTFELDDTRGRERVRLQHRTGTFIEMHPNGDEVHKVYGNGYEITIQDKNILVKGNCNLTVNGDANINIKGNKVEYIEGNYELHTKGNFNIFAEGMGKVQTQQNLDIRGGSNATGALTLSAGDVVQISADLAVDGEFTANKITSLGRIDAIGGVSAGAQGFVSVLGGLSIGIPVAVPLNIIAAGMVNSGVSVNTPVVNAGVAVNAPSGNFGVMTAIMMTDSVNTTIYDTHTHVAWLGGTSTPLSAMV